jgi:hypothetical protein
MAAILGLPEEVSGSELATRMSELAGANRPATPSAERIWVELEKSIEAKLVHTPRTSLEDAEAAQHVVSDVLAKTDWSAWVEAFAGDPDRPTVDAERNPDSRLRLFIARQIAPALADSGMFRLV